MWRLTNQTPYAAGRIWGRDKDGVHEWIVAVKGTFLIGRDGTCERAEEQLEPLFVAEYHGEDGASSLRYDADLVGPKPTTDILLNGTAYAPKGRPTTEFLVSLRVGDMHKQMRVVGNRTWKDGLLGNGPSVPEPVTQVPIVYERAYGGLDQSDPDSTKHRFDARNPVGCGLVKRAGQHLPNFEYPDGRIDTAGPAGFGALDSFWSPRLELQGTYDEAWKERRFPLLPTDWDPRSVLCSPADQRPAAHLRGGELVELENLTPSGKLSFVLPKKYYRFSTYIDKRTEEHHSHLATVTIEPDHARVILVWQSVLKVRNDGDYLDETIVTEKRLIGSHAYHG
jgi:hypothetical protein